MDARSIFITGAATGIGCATARRLDRDGWRVFAGAMPGQDTAELTDGTSDRLTVVELDITDPDAVAAAAAAVDRAVGAVGLNALHNNAGVADFAAGVLAGVDLDAMRRMFEINVFGATQMTQAILPLIHRAAWGRIVNMTSANVRVPVPISGVYMMTKCAIEAFTKTLRLELAPFGIEVVAIEPGGVRTPMTATAKTGMDEAWARMPQAIRERYEAAIRPANDALLKQLEKRNEPEWIVDGIVHALSVAKPAPRYTVGRDVRGLPMIQRLLPERTFESILLKQYGLRRGNANATTGGPAAGAPAAATGGAA